MTTGMKAGSKMFLQTALYAASFIWIWNLITGISICWFYGKGKAVKKGLPAVVIISLIQGGGQLLLTQVNTTIACFVPSCIALVAVFLIGRMKRYREPWSVENSPIMNRELIQKSSAGSEGYEDMNMFQAFVPYIVLTGITLFVLLITPVKNFLGQVSFSFDFPRTATGYGFVNEAVKNYSPITIFTHASMFLLLASVIGLIFYKKHGWIQNGGTAAVFSRSIKKTVPSGIAVIGFIIMSKIMGGTGQTMVLAQGIADVLGKGYAVLAPVVGMLGSFMTSSNMASNILFGGFQLETAKILGLNTAAILGAQTAGGAIGNTICPGNIILGTTTAEILGDEGKVLKRIMPITLSAAALVGVILFVLLVLV
jgi:lactate permease